MGRPPLPLGTSGKILFATLPNGRVKARVKFRDYGGRVRLVSKVGPSRAAAERALKAEEWEFRGENPFATTDRAQRRRFTDRHTSGAYAVVTQADDALLAEPGSTGPSD